MLRFTLIFATHACKVALTGANFSRVLARIVPDHDIAGFTVWTSNGYTVEYGRESGATVEFVATLQRAVDFATDVAKQFGQDSVYLACGSDAVLVDYRGHVETLTGNEKGNDNVSQLI